MKKEKKTAHEIASFLEDRIGQRATIIVMRDHPISRWHAQVVAPSYLKRLELQAKIDRISDALRERYDLEG
jgi:hypothetical protein